MWWANRDGSASRETYDEPTEARLYPGAWAPVRFVGLGEGVVLREWQVLGPFGGPGAEAFSNDPQHEQKDQARKLFEAASYPPDAGRVDPAASFSGELVRGWWGDSGTIRWKAATVAEMDNRVIFGKGAR